MQYVVSQYKYHLYYILVSPKKHWKYKACFHFIPSNKMNKTVALWVSSLYRISIDQMHVHVRIKEL